jgi:hypothetical protein
MASLLKKICLLDLIEKSPRASVHEFDDDASIHRLMVCVYGRNLDLVRSRRKTSDDDRPAATRMVER